MATVTTTIPSRSRRHGKTTVSCHKPVAPWAWPVTMWIVTCSNRNATVRVTNRSASSRTDRNSDGDGWCADHDVHARWIFSWTAKTPPSSSNVHASSRYDNRCVFNAAAKYMLSAYSTSFAMDVSGDDDDTMV